MLRTGLTQTFARSLFFVSAAAIMAACSSGGGSTSSALPPSQVGGSTGGAPAPLNDSLPSPTSAPTTTDSLTAQSTSAAFGLVQTADGGSTYASTVNVKLSKIPVAGHVLVLFFEQNQSAKFPYSGEVAWPAMASGSAWSYDGGTSSTAILHHVVQAGESGSYTLNVGGSGSGWASYVAAEISGANGSRPVNNVAARAIAAGTSQFSAGSITPTVAGTYPLAFFSAHQSGHSWSSVSSGWTMAATNTSYSELLASGPAQSAAAGVSATAILSGPSAYAGSADIVLLNPSSSSAGATPTPGPTNASPSPSPTSPANTTAYTYHGCQVYPVNDWFTTDLIAGGSSYVPNTIDPRSAAIIANVNASWPNINFNYLTGTIMGQETANVATNSTAIHTVQGTTMKNDPYNDDPNNVIPFQNGFYQEGTHGCTTFDCHVVVLNTQTCVDYETYDWAAPAWNGSTYRASNGFVHNLHHPLNDQYSSDGGNMQASGLPLMGDTDWGEDASLKSINHIVGFIAPSASNATTAFGGHVAPATNSESCARNCTNALPYGARLRLHASFVCPSAATNPQANLLCNQFKHYGIMFEDTWGGNSGGFGVRFGSSSNGSNPWNTSDLNAFLNNVHITDFDVMSLGTIH